MKRKYWLVSLIFALVVSACSPVDVVEPTNIPQNTSTPLPTETAIPTATSTLVPTATSTLEPSATPDPDSVYFSTLNDEQRTKLSAAPEYSDPNNPETKFYKRFGSGAFSDTVLYTTESGNVADGSPVFIYENGRFVPSLVFFRAGTYITNYKNDKPFVYQDDNVPNAQLKMVENILTIKQLLCRTGNPKMGMGEAKALLESGASCAFNFQERGELDINTPLEIRLEDPTQPPTFNPAYESYHSEGNKHSYFGLTGNILHIHEDYSAAASINMFLTGVLPNTSKIRVPWNIGENWLFDLKSNLLNRPSFTIGK